MRDDPNVVWPLDHQSRDGVLGAYRPPAAPEPDRGQRMVYALMGVVIVLLIYANVELVSRVAVLVDQRDAAQRLVDEYRASDSRRLAEERTFKCRTTRNGDFEIRSCYRTVSRM